MVSFGKKAVRMPDIIVCEADGRRRGRTSHWGLMPGWAADRSGAGKLTHARAETLLERGTFRDLLATRRCIVPASGFAGWRPGPSGTRERLTIRRADGHPLALAALWTTWRDPLTAEEVTSHTIITTAANGWMGAIQHRMPAILQRAAVDRWLDPTVTDPVQVLPLLGPCAEDVLVAHPVSARRTTTQPDHAQLALPLGAAV